MMIEKRKIERDGCYLLRLRVQLSSSGLVATVKLRRADMPAPLRRTFISWVEKIMNLNIRDFYFLFFNGIFVE